MKLWPSRSKAEIGPVTDLDAIVAEPIPFRFRGKIHKIKPIALDEFMKFTNAQARMSQVLSEEAVSAKDLAQRYHSVISAVCDTISLDDIMSMEQAQVAALYQLVIDAVMGQVDRGEGKKKRQRLAIYDSVERSFSPSVQESSDGLPPRR